MFHSSVSIVSFFFCSILVAQATVSIWNTQQNTNVPAENEDFCTHVRDSTDPLYQIWFSELGNIIRQNVQNIDQYRISNIFLQKPAIYHCRSFFVNLIIETYHDNPDFRRALKVWAQNLNQIIKRSLATSQELNIILRTYFVGDQIPTREHRYGIYIIQHQMIVNYILSQHEINFILRIARQCLINIIQMWKDNERLYIVIAYANHANVLEQFKTLIEQVVHCPLLLAIQ